MMKRIGALVTAAAILFCIIPFGAQMTVQAKAYSNAKALTPFVYKTGSYTALKKLTLYTSSDGSKSTGKSIPADTSVKVTSVSGEYGKVSYSGTTGWINLSYALNPQNKADVEARLNMLRKKFPDGKYWNRDKASENNPDGYTDNPCPKGHTDDRDNRFDGTGQCHGFAIKLGYDVFGIHASLWERHYDVNKVQVGDLIRYRSRHTVMVTAVYDTYFKVADCNWDYNCNIEWNRKMNKSYISFNKDNKSDGVYHCQINGGSASSSSTTTTKPATTTTTAKPATKYVLTTQLSASVKCTAVLAKSASETYYAEGVTKDGKTSFTFTAPAGKYPELVLVAEGYNEYCIKDFTLGKDSLPATVKLIKTQMVSASLSITKQPVNVTVKNGQEAPFSVTATGDGLTYQWYYKKTGATEWSMWKSKKVASFKDTVNASWDQMQVRCVITDSSGNSVTSSIMVVTVLPLLKITQQPVDVTVKNGQQASFAVAATGDGLTYQWYYKKTGATSWSMWKSKTVASFKDTVNATWDQMQVRCVITDSSGDSVTSSIMVVKVLPVLSITQQPANVSVKSGASATFTVKASGSGLQYQWYFKKSGATSWSAWNGKTTASITVTSNDTWDGMQVRCVITDSAGDKLTSGAAVVTLLPAITVTQQPANLSVKSGASATFSIKASGSGLQYQWYYKKSGATSWSAWNGKTTASITVTSNDTWNGMQVRCVITDSAGHSVTSSAAKVTLLSSLAITQQPVNVTVRPGENAVFSVKASGSGLQYQWYYKKSGATSWCAWNGKTTASITVTSNDTWNGMQVRCIITDNAGYSVTSSAAKVTLNLALTITRQPANIAVKSGAEVTFTIQASGSGLQYQWYYKKTGATSWSAWNGRTAASFASVANDSWNNMLVCCVVIDDKGNSLTSSSAKVTIQ